MRKRDGFESVASLVAVVTDAVAMVISTRCESDR